MSGPYDVVVVGSGHNGLAAAAYLARAGKSVLVLERASVLGGSLGTDEVAPGYRCSTAFQSAETLSPLVVRELGLGAHGLELKPAGGVALAAPEGWIRFDGRGRVARGSSKEAGAEADALAELERFVTRLVRALAPLYQEPLPELENLRAGDKLDLLRVGWRLRRLGRRDMYEAMRFLPMAMRDVVEERFRSDAVRALVAGLGLGGSGHGPYAGGTAFFAVHRQLSNPRPLFSGPVFARGGMGSVGEALAAAARAAGAEVRADTDVARIETELGVVRGVTVADGTHIEAGAVVSDAAPGNTLLSLLEPGVLDPDMVTAASNIRATAGVAVVRFALDELPRAPAGHTDARGLLAGSLQIGAKLEDQERAFDRAAAGALPDRPPVELTIPSLADPSLAPEGKHVACAWVHAVPGSLVDGDDDSPQPADNEGGGRWRSGRERLADTVVALVEEALPGFATRINARTISAPPDFEQRYRAPGGCLLDADLSLDQLLYLRPLPGLCYYRTPVGSLYQCGSGTHAGGGITALAGRNAARQILNDIKTERAG